jgi:hypothetical protein
MEPLRHSGSIRVNNREAVNLQIINFSPLDSFSLTRSPSPTAETNPFQALATAITGFGGLGLGPNSVPLAGKTPDTACEMGRPEGVSSRRVEGMIRK